MAEPWLPRQVFVNAPQRVLFVVAAGLVSCGTLDLARRGIDRHQLVIGFRVAAVLICCGVLAGQLRRHRALAMTAIDVALIVLAVMSGNYLRLALKWLGQPGGEVVMPVGVVLGAVCTLGFLLLAAFRPRRDLRGRDWWTVSPLLSLPAMVLWSGRGRHGIGGVRRFGMAVGVGLVVIGFVATNSLRLPGETVAGVVDSVRLVNDGRELIDAALNDRQRLAELLEDPSTQRLIDRVVPPETPEADIVNDLVDRVTADGLAAEISRSEIDQAVEALRAGTLGAAPPGRLPGGLGRFSIDRTGPARIDDRVLLDRPGSPTIDAGPVTSSLRHSVTSRIVDAIPLERIERRAPRRRSGPSREHRIDWAADGWWDYEDAAASVYGIEDWRPPPPAPAARTQLGQHGRLTQQVEQVQPVEQAQTAPTATAAAPVVPAPAPRAGPPQHRRTASAPLADSAEVVTSRLLWGSYVAGLGAMAVGLFLVASSLTRTTGQSRARTG